jgi:hypothetical protein
MWNLFASESFSEIEIAKNLNFITLLPCISSRALQSNEYRGFIDEKLLNIVVGYTRNAGTNGDKFKCI